jgi:NAD(P)-dependent dehydrogenase (short-subunit alcohol dehydrogenase family)
VSALPGKVALVTGGGSGIGQAAALAFSRAGAQVVVADIDLDAAQRTVDMIGSSDQAVPVQADVSQGRDVEAMVDSAVRQFGHLDIAFNNAGISQAGRPIHELSEDDWQRVIAIDLTSVFLCLKFEIAAMRRQNTGGAIVNTASVMGLSALPDQPGYIAAKHGVVGLTKAAAVENAAQGIRVNALAPGLTRSPMVDLTMKQSPEVLEPALRAHPMGRLGEPDEQASAVLWLCSDDSSYVTGHVLNVDGGFLSTPM